MPYEKGVISPGQGAPKGSKNAGKTRNWRNTIRRSLKQYELKDDDPKKAINRGNALRRVADELIAAATDRTDPHFEFAVKEIGLRLDGKPTEHIELGLDKDTAALGIGISAAFAQLVEMQTGCTVIDGEVVVQDRPLLPAKVCDEEEGHRE